MKRLSNSAIHNLQLFRNKTKCWETNSNSTVNLSKDHKILVISNSKAIIIKDQQLSQVKSNVCGSENPHRQITTSNQVIFGQERLTATF